MSKAKAEAHLTINIHDVWNAGSVRSAIHEWCDQSDDTCSGIVGPSFSTSGPGPGWSTNHTASDYARRALCEGALYYVDADNGRLASRDTVDLDDEECDDDGEPTDPDICYDHDDGEYFRIEWSDASVVCIECPTIEEAIEHPDVAAEMAQAVIDTHGPASDKAAWRKLIIAIREAAEAVADVDVDDLDD